MEKFFDETGKYDLLTYDNLQKITIGQDDDFTTRRLLDYRNFKKSFKINTIDLSSKLKPHPNPKAMQQTNFTENLE